MEYEKCYVFDPEENRAAKRRRTGPCGLQASWNARRKAYQAAWKRPQDRINEKLKTINARTVREIIAFLDQTISDPTDGRIATGLILAGANSALRSSIASQIAAQGSAGIRRIFVPMSSNAGTNLKGVLKTLILKATSRLSDDDENEELEDSAGARKGGPKLLNYDLQALRDHVQERHVQQVVVVIEDTEAFDNQLLSELIVLLGHWRDRIPLACLFSVATSVDFLQQRLSKSAARCISGSVFDAALSHEETEQVFDVLTASDNSLFLGAGVISMILERQTDYIEGIDSFVRAAQYAYMSCYYANALSIFLDPDLNFHTVPKDHFEALRNLPSFQDHARDLLEDGFTKGVQSLLDSDRVLFDCALDSIRSGRSTIDGMLIGANVVQTLQERLTNADPSTKSSLYVQAMSGKLGTSAPLRSLLLSLRKASSDIVWQTVRDILNVPGIPDEFKNEMTGTVHLLGELIDAQENPTKPLRSEDDIQNSTLRTTIIAQKVELSKRKSALSKQDAAYTKLVRQLSDTLASYLETTFVDPRSLPLNEIFLYDLKSPYREVFTPRPRAAIERALAAPHDYLDCECCQPGQGHYEEVTLAATQPATAILYQLYLESGNLINVSDLWHAFQAVVGSAEDGEEQQMTMALFQRALADLRHLGFVKNTRRRVDHIAKVAWKGL